MEDLEYIRPELSTGQWEHVLVTHVEDPEHFYSQLLSSETQLNDLMARIDAYCQALGPSDGNMVSLGLGLPCLAQYSEDNAWYRAIITGRIIHTSPKS